MQKDTPQVSDFLMSFLLERFEHWTSQVVTEIMQNFAHQN